ncbi:MAG: hypothetical protein ACTHNP_12310, partial [Solirubrobacterales bacterium]
MTLITRPNAWVAIEDAATQLTYDSSVNPAPLTTSIPGREPTLGSLVAVMTNNQGKPLKVSRVSFTVVIGKPGKAGAPLMSSPPHSLS